MLFAVGGAAKSDIWCQIKADVTGKPIRVPSVSEGTPLGAAIAAGVGVGVFGDVREGVKRMIKTEREFEPRADIHERYQELFSVYRGLYARLRDSMHALSEFGEG